MYNQTYTYRTKDGAAYFQFRYINHGEFFEIAIIDQPSYNGRDTNPDLIHRISSSIDEKKQVCILSEKKIEVVGTLEKAKNVSTGWAELTHHYIKTGITIDVQLESANH